MASMSDNKMEQKQHDDLTGFLLKKDFNLLLNQLIDKYTPYPRKTFSLILLDIDHFKRINDKLGHLFGDKVLEYMASTLKLSLQDEDSECFRYGGDEFIVVLPNQNSKEAVKIAARFKSNLARRQFMFKNKFLKITLSVGIANFPFDGRTIEDLIKKADEAMYFSKHHGRNATTVAGRVKSLKFIELALTGLLALVIIINLFLWRDFVLKGPLSTTIDIFQAVRNTLPPINCSRVTLNNGTVYNGQIMEETNNILTLNIDKGKGMITTMNLDKTDVAKIQYGLRTSSQQKYRDYLRDHPNPHLD